MKKAIIGLLAAALITLSLLGQGLFQTQVNAVEQAGWYKTVNGNLDTDTYTLYPYDTSNSLNIGFSQWGELINTLDNVGLEYGDVDPFAPPAGSDIGQIVKVNWLQGWLINITYYHRILAQMRTVWASALHADGYTFGNNWIRVDFDLDRSAIYGEEDPRDPGFLIGNYGAGASNYGGRKTNGTAVTQPIVVLYDGPRLYVARMVTRVYDHPGYLTDDTSADVPLVDVRITIIFHKVKKEVILLKELKTLVSDKTADELKVQFSNRGEVDLGVEAVGYDSYAHFYTEGTSRGPNWMGTGKNYENNDTQIEGLATVYDRDWVLNQTEDVSLYVNNPTHPFYNYSAAGPYPQSSDATYDLAVAINPNIEYTWWAAFWPSLSDWSIDAWDMWYRSMSANDPHDIDTRTWASPPRYEASIPFYIGEWDCILKPLGKTTEQQYRFVTVYGVTDQHDADDANMEGAGHTNVPDRETMYLLNEYFNPWDLQQAVHKKNTRWVEFTFGPSWTSDYKPVMAVSDAYWDQYCEFSERVIDLNTSLLLHRVDDDPLLGSTHDYHFSVDPVTGYATITGLNSSHYYKILYSTDTEYENWDDIPFTWTNEYNFSSYYDWYDYDSFTIDDPLGATHTADINDLDFTVTNVSQGSMLTNHTFSLLGTMDFYADDFKVFKEGETIINAYWWDQSGPQGGRMFHHVADDGTVEIDFTSFELQWVIDPPAGLDLHVDWLHLDVDYNITAFYNVNRGNWTIYVDFDINGDGGEGLGKGIWTDQLYVEHIPGRYEWGIVGRDAYSVDSAGLSLVSAAFKNKQVEYGLAGEDMFDPEVAAQMPWVMSKMQTGNTLSSYYYGATDYRVGLRDDWCTTWPISSSNMIGVGGPLANMLAYYGNDFADGLFGLDQFTAYSAWENQIVPLTCWNGTGDTHTYASSNATGYAVISTYKDLNGTVLFLIWGHWGRDTYYVTKWFHEVGIFQLQDAADGVTSIIVKIDYSSYSEGWKPTEFSIVEVLGTISERLWIHGSEHKGGIHDP